MPEVFRQLQELDEKRIRNVRHFMAHSADVERNVFPIINKCLDGIINAANEVNEKQVNGEELLINYVNNVFTISLEPLSLRYSSRAHMKCFDECIFIFNSYRKHPEG